MFSQPTSGGGFLKPRDMDGHLVLITRLIMMDRHFDSMKGAEIDRATVDIVDLDGDAELKERVWVTHAGLVNKISSTGPTLGRIGTVQFAKGSGFSLLSYKEGVDDAKAQAWIERHPEVSLTPVPLASQVQPAAAPVASFDNGPTGAMTLDQMRSSGNTATTTTALSRPTTTGGFDVNGMDEAQKAALIAALSAPKAAADTSHLFTSEPPF